MDTALPGHSSAGLGDRPAAGGGALSVTVCMIVLNEADRLERCLTSLGGLGVHEVILLDTGSTDETVALARSLGARVETAEWEGFSGSRRRVFEMATTEWIFWLDADEVLTDELRATVSAQFADGGPPADIAGFEINRMVELDGQWIRRGDWFPDWNLRIFRRDGWKMEERQVHESIQVEGRVERLTGLLEHYSFRDWDDLRRRSERYARLWAQQEWKRGRRTGPLVPEIRGLARFVRGYLLRGGFLDGGAGFRVARQIAGEVRMKHALLRTVGGSGEEVNAGASAGDCTNSDSGRGRSK